jgi:hypothetical protein
MDVSYSAEDWAADRSMSEKGWVNLPVSTHTITTPTGAFYGTDSSGYWMFSLMSISDSSVKYTDCLVSLAIGNQQSSWVSISTSSWFSIYLDASTGYTMEFIDSGTSGYMSAGDFVTIGPIGGGMGVNPAQPAGTVVTLTVYYRATGEAIASGTLVV